MNLEAYKRRLNGANQVEATMNATADFTNRQFENSPTFQVISIDGMEADVRVSVEKDSTKKQLLLRPYSTIHKGAIATFDGYNWLTLDFIGTEIYPKAKVKLCNQMLKWKDESNTLLEYPCIVTSKGVTYEDDEKYMVESDGNVHILVSYNNDTKDIGIKDRFVLGGRTYEVIGIDDISDVLDSKGILNLTVEVTSTSDGDNTDSGVADNGESGSGWGGW